MTDEDGVSVGVSVRVSVADADGDSEGLRPSGSRDAERPGDAGDRAAAGVRSDSTAGAPPSRATDAEPIEEGRRAPDRSAETPDERIRAGVERREPERGSRGGGSRRRGERDEARGLERLSDDGRGDRGGARESGARPLDANEGGDGDGEPPPQARFQVYEDRAGGWRWRLKHRNGNVLADSGQGYASRAGAERGLESVRRHVPGASVERLSSAPSEIADDSGDETGSE